MKWSEVELKELLAKSYAAKWALICDKIQDNGQSGEIALLLGTRPQGAIERARAAARLYLQGRVRHIVASGGVSWEHEGESLTEAELMARILRAEGVPDEAIILDTEARTTKENMICGTLAINRALGLKRVRHVIIVTTVTHMQRSLSLARVLLPRCYTVSAYPSYPEASLDAWLASAENQALLDNSITLTKGLVDDRIIEDIEINA